MNKTQRNFLQRIMRYEKMNYLPWLQTYCLGRDEYRPIKRGPVAEYLMAKGLLEEVKINGAIYCIRPTHEANKFKCGSCQNWGEQYLTEAQFDGIDPPTPCPECDATGLLLVKPSRRLQHE